jgi:hypothetical protein
MSTLVELSITSNTMDSRLWHRGLAGISRLSGRISEVVECCYSRASENSVDRPAAGLQKELVVW